MIDRGDGKAVTRRKDYDKTFGKTRDLTLGGKRIQRPGLESGTVGRNFSVVLYAVVIGSPVFDTAFDLVGL